MRNMRHAECSYVGHRFHAIEAADDALNLVLGKILGASGLGDLVLPGLPPGIPIALGKSDIGTAV